MSLNPTSTFWNDRYEDHETVYGLEPNEFLAEVLPGISPGTILFPAEGEGRNARFAARLGWHTDAFDFSPVAREKALALAAKENLMINYKAADLSSIELPPLAYDVVALIFVHMEPQERTRFHRACMTALKPGGVIILEAFSKDQLRYNSGGPKSEEKLYTSENLMADFHGLQIQQLEKRIVLLDEGPFHRGLGSVLRFIGRKAHRPMG